MEHEILDLIGRYWKFDDNQQPVSTWHDKQDLLEAVRKAFRIHDVEGQSEQFYCNCSRAKGLDNDEDGMPYCIECQKPVQ